MEGNADKFGREFLERLETLEKQGRKNRGKKKSPSKFAEKFTGNFPKLRQAVNTVFLVFRDFWWVIGPLESKFKSSTPTLLGGAGCPGLGTSETTADLENLPHLIDSGQHCPKSRRPKLGDRKVSQ